MGDWQMYLNVLTGLAIAAWFSACDAPHHVITPSIPTLTPAPTLTPTPPSALPLDHIWVGFEGLNGSVLDVSPDGQVSKLALPLNEEQQASEIIASSDGSTLVYLVWNAEEQQHGIAAWNLIEPNAHLVTQPLSGYRIISLYLTEDAASLLYVEVQTDIPVTEADWRLVSISPQGGQPTLLIGSDAAPHLLPPTPLGIAYDGKLLFNAAAKPEVENVEQGIYSFVPDNGHLDLISPPGDQHIVDGEISADGTRLVYMTSGGPSMDEPAASSSIVGARLLDLQSGQAITLAAPGGEDITSLCWYPDGIHLLLDVTPPGTEAHRGQFWARADTSQTLPWRQTSVDRARAALFSYVPYQHGVIYTLLPSAADTEWHLYLLPDIAANDPPQIVSLGIIEDNTKVPLIIRAP
ncbi:MAG: hypothetical protein JXB30_03700 [Anaerolineae bacterium]|nr:hypothetical protein [Anaerolineae bacterium]